MTVLLRDKRVRDWAAIAGVAILSLLVAYLFYDRQVRVAQLNAMSTALNAQRQQAVQAGQTPVAPPPAQILATPTAVAGPRGDTGAQGPAGPAGRGLSSIVCVSGVWHVAYTDGSMDSSAGVCTGPPGPIGATGPAGQSITGSTGPQGPQGPAGQDGQSIVGPTGPAGPAGTNGADGKPPASWTWTSPTGTQYRCDRDTSSPDSAPSYSCKAVSGLLP